MKYTSIKVSITGKGSVLGLLFLAWLWASDSPGQGHNLSKSPACPHGLHAQDPCPWDWCPLARPTCVRIFPSPMQGLTGRWAAEMCRAPPRAQPWGGYTYNLLSGGTGGHKNLDECGEVFWEMHPKGSRIGQKVRDGGDKVKLQVGPC